MGEKKHWPDMGDKKRWPDIGKKKHPHDYDRLWLFKDTADVHTTVVNF